MSFVLCLLAALKIFQVDPYDHRMCLPSADPPSGVKTERLAVFAAQGEFESVSFVAVTDRDIKKLDFRPTDFEGPNGAKIAASQIDFALVKTWYRAQDRWWNLMLGKIEPKLMPELILHDDALVKVDEEKRINYLRLYTDKGPTYRNISSPDEKGAFDDCLHKVMDAEKFVPFDLKKDRRQQYWVTVHVPENVPGGHYIGYLKVFSDGQPIRRIPIDLTVYPFKLPYARTHYDTSREYNQYWLVFPSLQRFVGGFHNLDLAEKKFRKIMRSMVEHNVTNPHGPGDFKTDTTDDLSVRALIIMRQEGMACREVLCGRAYSFKWWYRMVEKKSVDKVKEAETWKRCMDEYRAYVDFQMATLDRYLGHHKCGFCSGDEWGTDLHEHFAECWDYVHAKGGEIWVDSGKPAEIGWKIEMDDIPATCTPEAAWLRHNCGVRAFTYASPFAGPICPEIWRRTMGIRYYYADFDGVDNLRFFGNYNHWNDFVTSFPPYAQSGIVHLTYDGLISTLGWEAIREAFDDVRYLSLLRLRAEAALASKSPTIRRLGKREIKWMDSIDPETVLDLAAFRREVAKHIQALIAIVGPEPSVPDTVKPPPAVLPPSTTKRF